MVIFVDLEKECNRTLGQDTWYCIKSGLANTLHVRICTLVQEMYESFQTVVRWEFMADVGLHQWSILSHI